MNNSIYSSLFLIVIFCTSCNNSSNQQNNKVNVDYLNNNHILTKENRDTLFDKIDSLTKKENKITELNSVDDYLINEKDKSSKVVRRSIENEIEQWKNVTNPFIASYQGCDFGDYFHLNFKDVKNKHYDFGFGDNNYGEYSLFDSIHFNDNQKYIGKSFKIYWNWKLSSFPCCDGEYNLVKAYLPSITKLELTEKNANKK